MRKLLLIDDDPFSHKLLDELFRKEWKILNETALDEIKKLLNANEFALIVLNVSMRITDGEKLFHSVHDHAPTVPLVVVTSPNHVRTGRSLLRKGAFWHLPMPLNTDDLEHVMNTVVKFSELRESARSTKRDFSQLERGIAKMFSPLRETVPATFSFEQDGLIQAILNLLAEILEVEKVSLMLLDPETEELRIKAATGLTPYVIQNTVRKLGEGIAGWVAKEGKPLLIKDVEHDEQFSESPFYHQYTTKSLVCVPLKAGERVVGVLSANNRISGDTFNEKDLYLTTVFSHLLLLSLQSAQLHYEREKVYARESELTELHHKMTAALEPRVLFQILLKESCSIFQAEHAFLFELEEKGNQSAVHYLNGSLFAQTVLPATQIRHWLSLRTEPRLVNGGPEREEFSILRGILKEDIRCWLSAPIVIQGRLAGSIELSSIQADRFHQSDKQSLIRVAQQASLALNNARLYARLLDSIKEISDARKEVERVRRGQFL